MLPLSLVHCLKIIIEISKKGSDINNHVTNNLHTASGACPSQIAIMHGC